MSGKSCSMFLERISDWHMCFVYLVNIYCVAGSFELIVLPDFFFLPNCG